MTVSLFWFWVSCGSDFFYIRFILLSYTAITNQIRNMVSSTTITINLFLFFLEKPGIQAFWR